MLQRPQCLGRDAWRQQLAVHGILVPKSSNKHRDKPFAATTWLVLTLCLDSDRNQMLPLGVVHFQP